MRKFILGTDWWTDCDDAVALRLICNSVKSHKIELCGVIINACMEHSVCSMDGFLSKEKLNDIPIGIDLNGTDFRGSRHSYQKRLANYATRYKDNYEAEDGVRLYRRLLAGSDEPVEIIEIGFLQVVADLLCSEPDDISPLCGTLLVKSKVKKFWVMAGKWDEPNGYEHNFKNSPRSIRGGSIFCEKCPVPVTFVGFEVGKSVITGGNLDPKDHLFDVLADWGCSGVGRDSWDPITALLAVIGDEAEAGYDTVVGTASVDLADGCNHFKQHDGGRHRYVIKLKDDGFYQDMINSIIVQM